MDWKKTLMIGSFAAGAILVPDRTEASGSGRCRNWRSDFCRRAPGKVRRTVAPHA